MHVQAWSQCVAAHQNNVALVHEAWHATSELKRLHALLHDASYARSLLLNHHIDHLQLAVQISQPSSTDQLYQSTTKS
jgi:hypothetical protein